MHGMKSTNNVCFFPRSSYSLGSQQTGDSFDLRAGIGISVWGLVNGIASSRLGLGVIHPLQFHLERALHCILLNFDLK